MTLLWRDAWLKPLSDFDVGLSATEIAEAMKINRNTINDDIRMLYKEVVKEAPEYSEYFCKQMARLESQ